MSNEQTNGLLKSDDGAALRFFFDASRNEYGSNLLGRPVYDKVLYVEVITPGAKECAPVIEVRRDFYEGSSLMPRLNARAFERYGKQIEHFLGLATDLDLAGTPVDKWPVADTPMVAMLRECRIYTVEGLAAVPDSSLDRLGPGGRELRERAKAFLAAAAAGAGDSAAAAENVHLRAENERLNGLVVDLDRRLTSALEGGGADGELARLRADVERLNGELSAAKAATTPAVTTANGMPGVI